jgi:hypothetical protein
MGGNSGNSGRLLYGRCVVSHLSPTPMGTKTAFQVVDLVMFHKFPLFPLFPNMRATPLGRSRLIGLGLGGGSSLLGGVLGWEQWEHPPKRGAEPLRS